MTYMDWSALKDRIGAKLMDRGFRTPNNIKNYREEYYGSNWIVYFNEPQIVCIIGGDVWYLTEEEFNEKIKEYDKNKR